MIIIIMIIIKKKNNNTITRVARCTVCIFPARSVSIAFINQSKKARHRVAQGSRAACPLVQGVIRHDRRAARVRFPSCPAAADAGAEGEKQNPNQTAQLTEVRPFH